MFRFIRFPVNKTLLIRNSTLRICHDTRMNQNGGCHNGWGWEPTGYSGLQMSCVVCVFHGFYTPPGERDVLIALRSVSTARGTAWAISHAPSHHRGNDNADLGENSHFYND